MNSECGRRGTRSIQRKGSLFFGDGEHETDCITITLVANAGVLVEHKGTALLIDGMHCQKGHPFSTVSANDIRHMRHGLGRFRNLDYLLFTHEHPDHFTPQYVYEHILSRPVKGLFLPGNNNRSTHHRLLLDNLLKFDIPHWILGLEPGETKRFVLADDLMVTAIGTRHMGPQYQTIRNDCFLLTMGRKNLLFTGDSDHVADYFETALTNKPVEAVFVNPMFYHNPKGQEIIKRIFRPHHIIVYHLPFKPDDTMRFSQMIRRDTERYHRPKVQTHIFSSRHQFLRLQ